MKSTRILFALSLCCLAGCRSGSAGSGAFTRVALLETDVERVFEAAQQTMNEYFRIAHIDPARRHITSAPVLDSEATEGRLLGPNISSPKSVRRIAELKISRRDGAITAQCRVVVQKQDTAQERAFHRSSTSVDDTPGQTPLEEHQGLDREANVTWSHTGYDRKLEREMLAALAERVDRQ